MASISLTTELRSEYQRLFDTCVIRTENLDSVNKVVNTIRSAKERYAALGEKFNIPWFFIGIVHCMEGSLSFNKHLHNGDPLTAKTVQVPAGRPKTGNPPFTWEASAEDALKHDKVDQWVDWTIPGILFKLEGFNGYGYRKLALPINSPYLWSMSNQYTKGKFVADGEYSATAVSKQTGAAVLLRRMNEIQLAPFGITDRLTMVIQLGEAISFAPNKFSTKALELQRLLNLAGAHILPDGKAGRNTSDAYFSMTGNLLAGDPQLKV